MGESGKVMKRIEDTCVGGYATVIELRVFGGLIGNGACAPGKNT